MTQKQFEEVVKVNKRIEQLNRVLEEFKMHNSCRLSLVYGGYNVDGYCKLYNVNAKVIDFIEDKLKVYTGMFIQEINKEIEELNKKIEEF